MVKGFPDLERGESASVTGRRHIPTRVFKQAARLTKQAARITAALEGINPINAGKKRDEAITLLQKFFPDMEDFETKTRRYKREFERLEKENADLVKKVDAAKPSVKDRLAEGTLRSELQDLRRFVDSLPEEIRRQARPPQKSHGQRR
jgi:hypothetical protein